MNSINSVVERVDIIREVQLNKTMPVSWRTKSKKKGSKSVVTNWFEATILKLSGKSWFNFIVRSVLTGAIFLLHYLRLLSLPELSLSLCTILSQSKNAVLLFRSGTLILYTRRRRRIYSHQSKIHNYKFFHTLLRQS